jgi:hypothetical protein
MSVIDVAAKLSQIAVKGAVIEGVLATCYIQGIIQAECG